MGKSLAQLHVASKWQNEDWNLHSLVLEPLRGLNHNIVKIISGCLDLLNMVSDVGTNSGFGVTTSGFKFKLY